MIRSLPLFLGAFVLLFANGGLAQPGAGSPTIPMPPLPSSPVDFFRKLLATNAAGREAWLAAKPVTARQYIEGKVREYEAMSSEQREARLQALQMRWYMRYFMKLNPLERGPRLATVPEPERSAIRRQLVQWDPLPPQLKKDVLENENLIRLVAGETGKVENIFAAMTEDQRRELQGQYDRWNQLPAARRNQIFANFKNVFELPHAERNKVLEKLTEAERAQMDKTLSNFGSLPRDEREQALQGFKKFAELSPAERAAFLKTASRWKAMTEQERELWRKVVVNLQAKRSVPLPPNPPVNRPTLMATNY